MNYRHIKFILVALIVFSSGKVTAHDGRGFMIEVAGFTKLQVQGVNTGSLINEDAVRPYVNSIHDHWSFYDSQNDFSFASFPEFEVSSGMAVDSFLLDYSLDLELKSAWQWIAPPAPTMLIAPNSIVPQLEPLDSQKIISISTLGVPIDTVSLGVLELSEQVPSGGTGDIIPSYRINGNPSNEIQILEFILAATPDPNDATPNNFIDSDPIYVIMSPNGTGPVERLHFASLYLEEYLAMNGLPTAVPEPSAVLLQLTGLTGVLAIRKRA